MRAAPIENAIDLSEKFSLRKSVKCLHKKIEKNFSRGGMIFRSDAHSVSRTDRSDENGILRDTQVGLAATLADPKARRRSIPKSA